jgi:hypothetical protein
MVSVASQLSFIFPPWWSSLQVHVLSVISMLILMAVETVINPDMTSAVIRPELYIT